MIDSGNYEEAYRYGIDKLVGKKNKKTKYVRALEKAYHRLNELDNKEITRLQSNGSITALTRVVNIYERMEQRQTYIDPLLPLISEDGYIAEIENQNLLPQIITAQKRVSDHHFTKAETAIVIAGSGDKSAAKQAYLHYRDANIYIDNYRGSASKMQEAYELGQTYILIENYVPNHHAIYYHASTILNQRDPYIHSTEWTKYISPNTSAQKIDYIATIEIEHITTGTERERYNSYTKTMEVITGQKKVLKKIQKSDTTQHYTMIDIKSDVTAEVEEIYREKSSELQGKIMIIENKTQQHIRTIPLNITHHFEDYAIRINGDHRALTKEVIQQHKEYCAPFPTDFEMVATLAENFSNASIQALKDVQLR